MLIGAKNKNKANKKMAKLKPKAQWDRFLGMKGAESTRIRVAVRTVNNSEEEEEDEWLQVGHVKSVNNAYTELAVARQRALICRHLVLRA